MIEKCEKEQMETWVSNLISKSSYSACISANSLSCQMYRDKTGNFQCRKCQGKDKVHTMGKLFFLRGPFFLFVICNKAHGSGRLQSSDILVLKSSSSLLDSSSAMSASFTSSSKGRSGPISRLLFIGFIAEAFDWMVEYTWYAPKCSSL